MTTTQKMTKRDYFNILLSMVPADKPEIVEFINHEIELLERKAEAAKNAEHKPTAKQKENDEVRENIVQLITKHGKPMSAKEICETTGITSARIAALLTHDERIINVASSKSRTKLYAVKGMPIEE